MMIVVANLRLSGFFRLVSNWVVARARHPLVLLMAIVLVAGSFSAFLVNDTICLVMTPLVLDLVTRLKRDPVPYLLAIPMASNVGSTATITGNPQNMIIGSLSHIPYGTFAAALWPVAAVGAVLTALLIALVYRREFLTREHLPAVAAIRAHHHQPLVIKSVLVAVAMMVLFFAGQPVAKVAIVGGALLLVTRQSQGRQGLSRDRLAAPPHVRRALRRCDRTGNDGVDPGNDYGGRPARSRDSARPRRGHGRAVESS